MAAVTAILIRKEANTRDVQIILIQSIRNTIQGAITMNNQIIKIGCVATLAASLILSSTSSIGDRHDRQGWQGQLQGQQLQENWHHDRHHGSSVYIGINPGLYNGNFYYYNQPVNYQLHCGWVATQYDFDGNVISKQWVCQ